MEGRAIRCLRIQSKMLAENESVKGILIIGGVHGREWVTISSTLYLAAQLIDLLSNPHQNLTFLQQSSIHVVPVVNPDGYAYTWTLSPLLEKRAEFQRLRKGTHTGTSQPNPALESRFWRPNRRKFMTVQDGIRYLFVGVDLNRNWGNEGTNWGKGVSSIKSKNFQGKSGFSEPETKAIRRYAMGRKDITAFVDVHCCSRNIIAPFSLVPYNASLAADFAEIGKNIVARMQATRDSLRARVVNISRHRNGDLTTIKSLLSKPYFYQYRPLERKTIFKRN